MIPIDVKIESLIHRSFIDFRKNREMDVLSSQLKRFSESGFQFKMVDSIKGEVNELIQLAEYYDLIHADQEGFVSFIKEEKLAALRLLKFNKAAELADIENILDIPNQKTTATPVGLKPLNLVMYYCVFLRGKDVYILIDTNYHQFHWALRLLIRSFKELGK